MHVSACGCVRAGVRARPCGRAGERARVCVCTYTHMNHMNMYLSLSQVSTVTKAWQINRSCEHTHVCCRISHVKVTPKDQGLPRFGRPSWRPREFGISVYGWSSSHSVGSVSIYCKYAKSDKAYSHSASMSKLS